MVKRVTRICNLINSQDDSPSQQIWTNQIADISSQESSESEFVEEEKPWPPHDSHHHKRSLMRQVSQRLPRPHSHLFRRGDGHSRQSRHSRRWENSAFLSSLHVLPEDEGVTTPLPDHHSPFTTLHNSDKHMQIWTSFSSRSEEEQHRILQGDNVSGEAVDSVSSEAGDPGVRGEESTATPEQRFRNIDSRIRSILQHNRHLPKDLLSILEDELCYCFSADPQTVLLSAHSNSFSRLLLHGLCQFMGLDSTTVKCGDVSVVMVVCRRRYFVLPDKLLSNYLKTR